MLLSLTKRNLQCNKLTAKQPGKALVNYSIINDRESKLKLDNLKLKTGRIKLFLYQIT